MDPQVDRLPVEPFAWFVSRALLQIEDVEDRSRLRQLLKRAQRRGFVHYDTVDRECYRYGWHPVMAYGKAWFE